MVDTDDICLGSCSMEVYEVYLISGAKWISILAVFLVSCGH